jgi:hypothetical protein
VSVTSIGPEVVKVSGTGPGVTLQVAIGTGISGRLNRLEVHVVSLTGRTAVLRFSPA